MLVYCGEVKKIEIIGETAYNLTDTFREKHPETPWKVVMGKRYVLVHDYYMIKESQVRYTTEDLDWKDEQSRSTIEMKDSTARPEVASKVENMDQYDTIYVGFPIWWYTAPRIINTFLEQYDLTGKTIIPFATSGGSDMGKSGEDLKKASAPNANWILPGKVLNGNPPVDSLKVWIETLK